MKRIFAVALFALLLVGCKAEQPQIDETANEPSITEKAKAEKAEAENKSKEELPALDIETVVSLLEDSLEKSFKNYEVVVSDGQKSCLVYVWDDGLSVLCVKAGKGISSALKEWNQITDGMKNLSLSVQGMFDSAGLSDVSASIVIRNDLNPDAVLMMTRNGRVILDAANG